MGVGGRREGGRWEAGGGRREVGGERGLGVRQASVRFGAVPNSLRFGSIREPVRCDARGTFF